MLTPEEHRKLKMYLRIIKDSKRENRRVPLTAYDVEWLAKTLERVNEACTMYHETLEAYSANEKEN